MDASLFLKMNYRDKSYAKYVITAELNKFPDVYFVKVDVISEDKRRYRASFDIQFNIDWVRDRFDDYEGFQATLGSSENSPLIRNLIRDALAKTNLDNLNGKHIYITRGSEYDKRITLNTNGLLSMDLDPVIFATENKFARELILKELYALQSLGGKTPRQGLKDKCHYFDLALNNAIEALFSREYIKSERDYLTLTYSGLIFVEDRILSPFNGKIFLIAACRDEIEQLIDKVYRPAVSELGYDLRFQEQSEPKNSIHDDIWEYIEGCKLILCDLSYKRPNCFIEYGYALAKGKQIILCVEETQGKTKNGYIKVPFDTQNQKYSFWSEEWLTEKKHKLKLENFKTEIKERVEEKLALLDVASEI